MELEVMRVEIAKLDLKSGDILAVKLLRKASNEDVKRIHQHISDMLPRGVKLLLHDMDLELRVMRPSEVTIDHEKG